MKRKAAAQPGIKDAFAKAKQASNKQAKRVQFLALEADVHSSIEVPRVYVDGEVSQKYEQYRDENRSLKEKLLRAAQQRRTARSSGSGSSGGAAPAAGTPASSTQAGTAEAAGVSPASAAAAEAEADAAAAAASDLQALAERWQSRAAFVVHHLEAWAGSRVALQQQLQEMLMHIIINYDLHPDPRISVRAYRLLVQNLSAHPPLKPAAVLQEGQPRQLLRNTLSWNPLAKAALDADNKDAADGNDSMPMGFKKIFGGARFSLLQNLVRNAVQLVTGNSNSACWNVRPPGLQQVSTGKALLLLWLVQLLQADAHVRLAVFEEHMLSCKGLDADEVKMVKSRAASVLSESLLHKLMRDDFGWSQESDSETGRHRLVRDLLVMVASSADDAPAATGADSLAAATAAAAAGLAASATPAAAAGSGSDPELAAAEAVAAAAAVRAVSAGDMIGAARRLLLLLFQLYTGMEAAGAYAAGGGVHHAARGAASQNDRWWLDNVLLMGLAGARMMQAVRVDSAGPVRAAAALQRALQALPAVHALRLIALGVAEAIKKRPYDDPNAAVNNHVEALHVYCADEGKGFAEFRRGDALEIMKALADRLKWAITEVLGGKEAFTLMLCSLVSAALPGKQLPRSEQAEFVQVAQKVLDGVLQQSRTQLARACAAQERGTWQVLLSLGAAMQLLHV